MDLFRKITEKAIEAKTQFDEHRRAEKESTLNQTERRLDALQSKLKQKEVLLADKERALRAEESRLRKLSHRPMYVLILCTVVYGITSVLVLASFDLVRREQNLAIDSFSSEAPAKDPAVSLSTSPTPTTSSNSGREANIQETYHGIDLTRPTFDVGKHCLAAEKKGHITFEQCLGLGVAKAKAEGRR